MQSTEAWVLYAGDPSRPGPTELKKELYSFADLEPDETLVEPIYGSWEANMSHALARSPVDVPYMRGEDKVVLGNCALLRVLQPGPTTTLRPGDLCIIVDGAIYDRFGYPEKVWAYDWPNTIGFLAKQVKVKSSILGRIPSPTRFTPQQWATFTVRYATAYSNWQVAYRCWRSQISETDMPKPFVWGWGGGTSLGSLHLARELGFPAALLTASDKRRSLLDELGIQLIDRRQFKELVIDEKRFASESAYRKAYKQAEDAFYELVLASTDSLGVSIFFDYLGSPVIRATLRALARQGVISTAGWKYGTTITTMRALECIRRHIHVNTHYCRRGDTQEAMQFAERTGWMSPVDAADKVWGWEEIPALAESFGKGELDTYFPLFQVNPL